MTTDKSWVRILIYNDCGTEKFLNVFFPVKTSARKRALVLLILSSERLLCLRFVARYAINNYDNTRGIPGALNLFTVVTCNYMHITLINKGCFLTVI